MTKTGFFKPSDSKKIALDAEKRKILAELVTDYEEVDGLKIKDTISNYVTDETNYYDIFKLATYNFKYITALLKKEDSEISLEDIKGKIDELQKYIYDNYVDIIDNIKISEGKDIEKIMCEKYKLNSINVNPENLELDQIDKYIQSVDRAILYFDVEKLNLDLIGIKFILDSKEMFNRID